MGVMARAGRGRAEARGPPPPPVSSPLGTGTGVQAGTPGDGATEMRRGQPPSSYYTRKPVDAMTREEVDRRRNADLNRTTDDPNLSPAEQRRRERARQAYEDAAHNHGHYGEAAH